MFTNANVGRPSQSEQANDFWGRFMKVIFVIILAIFPWFVLPNLAKPMELPREILLFMITGFLLMVWFLRALKRRMFEWRRTKLGWVLGLWLLILGILFLYSKNFMVNWTGYAGSLTGGLSEYLAFIVFYFLATQVFSEEEWKKNIGITLSSLVLSLLFFIAAAVYFKSNSILSINFAKTPTLVTATGGIMALSYWWTLRKSEEVRKGKIFILILALFFISSLLDFHVSWWMWVGGALIILIFDIISRLERYRQEEEIKQLGINKPKGGLMKLFFRGDAKYLFLILLFAFSRAISPIFLGQQKITVLPFISFLNQYPILGQRVVFYLLVNFLVFCLGAYYYFRSKKDRLAAVMVMSGLAGISIGHLFYYSESAILYMLNWLVLVLAGVTYLRSMPEKDFLRLITPRSKGEGMLVAASIGVAVIVVGLIVLRVREMFV